MKSIRIIIALSLILATIALDMSSAKRRASTSNYAAMTAELGLTSGYKTWGDNQSAGTSFPTVNFYLKFNVLKGQKPISCGGTYAYKSTNNFNLDNNVSFPIDASWPLPKEFKSTYCSTYPGYCLVTDVKAFNLLQANEYYYAVTYTSKAGKEEKFHIIITNGGEVTTTGFMGKIGKPQMQAMADQYKNARASNIEFFLRKVNEIIQKSDYVIKDYEGIVSIQNKKNKPLQDNLKEGKKYLENALNRKNTLVNEIAALNAKIAQRDITIANTQSDREKCINELITLTQNLAVEEAKVAAAEAKKKADIAAKKAEKAKVIKKVFYYLEACYFFRVFAEKLIKAEADVDAALTGAHVKTTEKKLQTAFYPIKVQFANAGTK